MSSPRYDVVVLAFRLNAGVRPATALELALKLDARTARMLVERFPCVVLSSVASEQAQQARAALERFGANVELRESRLGSLADKHLTSSGAPPAPAPPAPARPPVLAAPAQRVQAASYELGEILAPMGGRSDAGGARKPMPSSHPPGPARFPIELGDPSDTPAGGTRKSLPDFIETAMDDDQPMLEVDPRAWAAIQRPITRADKPRPASSPPGPRQRDYGAIWRAMLGALGPMATHALLFAIIASLTVLAVGWALQPAGPQGLVSILPITRALGLSDPRWASPR